MSVLTDLIYGGSNAVAGLTENAVNEAIAKYGADKAIAFPDTAYYFPTIYAATGVKVKTLGDLPACVGVLKSLITNKPELGDALAETMIAVCGELGLCPVFQCCEHLNRALVMEQDLLDRLRLTQVNVMPVPKAGGSTGAAAYQRFEHPAVAQFIQADAAIDVGDTLVGMHVRPVAVPLRMEGGSFRVGQAHVTMAYSRLPYIGGSRAQYPNG